MTLHDRIMALPKRTPGQHDVVVKAASMAAEADELIGKMAAALLLCSVSPDDEAAETGRMGLELYSEWKEGNQ